MKAAVYRERGPAAQVLHIEELPQPSPGPGQVLVRVVVSAVNPSDTKGRSGWQRTTPMPFPAIVPHQDGAGVIEAVGEGVPANRVGQRVWIYMAQRDSASGTCAQYTVVDAWKAVPLPDAATFEQGAMMGIPAMTAHYALYDRGPVRGRNVLVQGGAGAVGYYAIQLAKAGGARRVIATVSREEQALRAREAGADAVINRTEPGLQQAIEQAAGGRNAIDVVVEVALGANLELDVALMATGGVIAAYSSDAVPAPSLPMGAMMWKDLTVRTLLIYLAPEPAREAAAAEINRMLAAGTFRHQVSRTFPLEEVVAAHEAMESGREVGKILVRLSGEP